VSTPPACWCFQDRGLCPPFTPTHTHTHTHTHAHTHTHTQACTLWAYLLNCMGAAKPWYLCKMGHRVRCSLYSLTLHLSPFCTGQWKLTIPRPQLSPGSGTFSCSPGGKGFLLLLALSATSLSWPLQLCPPLCKSLFLKPFSITPFKYAICFHPGP